MVVFRFKVLFYVANNSVPKFIFRLSRFPVYRGSGLGRFHCIKIWIVIYYRGLKFPHRAVFLLVLESDGACTGLNGHCARETAVLVLVWCYKARGDREQDLWRCWLSEGCIKQWCDKPSGCGCVSKKCELGEQWNSDLAVTRILSKHSNIHSENSRFKTLCFTPLTGNSSDTVVRSLLPLLFLRSVSSPIINIVVACMFWSCHELDPRSIFHLLGFITANFLHICVMIIAGLLKFQALIWMAVHYGKFLTAMQTTHMVRLFEF